MAWLTYYHIKIDNHNTGKFLLTRKPPFEIRSGMDVHTGKCYTQQLKALWYIFNKSFDNLNI